MPESLISLILAIFFIAIVFWGLSFLELEPRMDRFIRGVISIVIVIWLLGILFGWHNYSPNHLFRR